MLPVAVAAEVGEVAAAEEPVAAVAVLEVEVAVLGAAVLAEAAWAQAVVQAWAPEVVVLVEAVRAGVADSARAAAED